MDNDGNYRYQKELIGRAHLWNRTRAQNAASQGVSPIIIDNTNTMMREMKPYIGIARHFGYIVELEEMKTPWSTNFRELGETLVPLLCVFVELIQFVRFAMRRYLRL